MPTNSHERAPRHTTRVASSVFATTHWTEVIQASQPASPQAAQALENLCQKYWYPLYAFIRRQGHDQHDAQDLTQSFFARFLEKRYLADIDPARGKFRSFLLASLKHFLANEWDRARAKKRGGDKAVIPLDREAAEARYAQEPQHGSTPEMIYDRRWALTILEQALGRLEQECEAEGKIQNFRLLKQFLMQGEATLSQAELAKELGLTPAAAKVAAHRLRRRFRELLRAEIAQTVSSRSEIEDELRYLFSVITS